MLHAKIKIRFLCRLCIVGAIAFAGHAANAEVHAQSGECNGRIIVKFRDGGKPSAQLSKHQMAQLGNASNGETIVQRRVLPNGARLIQRSSKNATRSDAEYIRQLMRQPDIEYAECDAKRRIHLVPNDPGFPGNDLLFPDQWYLNETAGGVAAEQAWDISETFSINPTVVAIVDTGILPHEDLDSSRILPGYDFFSRDNDPSDPGDAEMQGECGDNDPPENTQSSWHGTAIAGIIAAQFNNATGIAGIDHNSDILPIRALGKCGGSVSDIADAIRWAVGESVSGVPDNSNPADVINLSFGSEDTCSITEQSAINAAINAGALVVVSAGNEGADINGFAPANCDNVFVITATTRQGGETCYTNVGPEADLAAPGGNVADENNPASNCTGNPEDALITTSNTGTGGPDAGINEYKHYAGTSFAAPMVSAAAALIKATDPSLNSSEIESLLTSAARAFPQNTTDSFGDCNTDRCGNGILDINAALNVAISASGVDIVPDSFSFTSKSDVTASTNIISESITVSGINVPAPISITSGEYSINDGIFTAENGLVAAGDSVRVQLTSGGIGSSTRTATLNIGGVTADFTVVTRTTMNSNDSGSNDGGGSLDLFTLLWITLLGLHVTLQRKPQY